MRKNENENENKNEKKKKSNESNNNNNKNCKKMNCKKRYKKIGRRRIRIRMTNMLNNSKYLNCFYNIRMMDLW